MSKNTFDFASGDLSLDYANTMDWHARENPEGENLNRYEDVITWGEQAGLVSPESARQIRRSAVENPQRTAAAYDYAIRVREAIYRIFSSRYAEEPIPEDDLELLNSVLCEAMSHLELTLVDGDIQLKWGPEIEGINLVLWPVARSAAELLTSDKAGRVRECEDDRGCGYLFIDQSKNHSRRWCSMESCGNRAKARRHYQKTQAG